MMVRKRDISLIRNPFDKFVCDGCGKELGNHFLFRPEKMADIHPGGHVGPNGRKIDGKLYCNRDGLGWAQSYHQRVLKRNTIDHGYAAALGILPKQGVPSGYQEMRYGR